jgi:hypothetical protein
MTLRETTGEWRRMPAHFESAISRLRPNAERRARTTAIAILAKAQNGTSGARGRKAGPTFGDFAPSANRQRSETVGPARCRHKLIGHETECEGGGRGSGMRSEMLWVWRLSLVVQ